MKHGFYISGNRITSKDRFIFSILMIGVNTVFQTTWALIGLWIVASVFDVEVSFPGLAATAFGLVMIVQSPDMKIKMKLKD